MASILSRKQTNALCLLCYRDSRGFLSRVCDTKYLHVFSIGRSECTVSSKPQFTYDSFQAIDMVQKAQGWDHRQESDKNRTQDAARKSEESRGISTRNPCKRNDNPFDLMFSSCHLQRYPSVAPPQRQAQPKTASTTNLPNRHLHHDSQSHSHSHASIPHRDPSPPP